MLERLIALARKIIPNGLIRAYFFKVVRWLAATASSALATWLALLLKKHGFPTDGHIGAIIRDIVWAAGTLVTSVGALVFSLWDGKLVDTQLKTAAATGVVAPAGAPMAEEKSDAAKLRADVGRMSDDDLDRELRNGS